MSAPVTRCEVGFPSDWIAWTVGEGPERSAALAARRTDDPQAQDALRATVEGTDASLVSLGGVVTGALWVPDASTAEVLAVGRVELLAGDPGRPFTRDELLVAKRGEKNRAVKVFDRGVEPAEVPAGPAVVEITLLAEKRGVLARASVEAVQLRLTYTVVPPGTYDAIEIELVTTHPELLDALGPQAQAIASSLVVHLDGA
jgi:hypothetical protein